MTNMPPDTEAGVAGVPHFQILDTALSYLHEMM